MTKIYETPYGNVHLPVTSPIVTVRCSGGFDSALLLYLIAQACTENNPDAIIQPLTVVRTNEVEHPSWHRVDNLPIVDGIVDWVRTQFPSVTIRDKNWKDAFKWWENNNISYTGAQRALVDEQTDSISELEGAYSCRVFDYNGVTKNPPVPMTINDMHQHRELKRDDNDANSPAVAEGSCTVIHNLNGSRCRFVEPWRNADKRVTMYIARQLGVFEKINEISRSCEGDRESTDSWTKTCGVCWWCQERDWAMKATA